ncbi:MAG: MerC domain-containing protein [Saprospiraceae bacterium]|nr:MerC domain-containing protein [Saprospiraceae bacterium]
MDKYFKINADTAGFFTSMLCALHCSAIPVLISLGLVGTGSWLHNHLFDWIIIGIGVVIASYSLVGDFISKHRRILPLSMAAVGFLFLLIGMVEHHGWMLVFSVVGGLLVASSHMINFRYSGSCAVKQSA